MAYNERFIEDVELEQRAGACDTDLLGRHSISIVVSYPVRSLHKLGDKH
jgi:hypothetical protein